MCTMISTKHPMTGQAKGRTGWFPIGQVYLAYDHPERSQLEHAVLLDFANEDVGPDARLAVELSIDQATALARHILATVDQAQSYEKG
ncbi:MAG TPA: DUF6295 family protein [Acidimicrobiia bacterium]|nr:DUF6295 family protein [Acidimicrobiia bacterium]